MEYPPTIIIRHKKENLKKCSLRVLERHSDFFFFRYPLTETPPYHNYVMLTLDSPIELSASDRHRGVLILDGTWRYAERMAHHLPQSETLVRRRLPAPISTAYPRRQGDCKEPQLGLASIEAIYCAYLVLGRSVNGLLDHYYWRDSFLEKNTEFLLMYTQITLEHNDDEE